MPARASKALSRFTVLDLTRVRAGPTCVRQLADWGANVIKIEMPEHVEAADMGGPRTGPGLFQSSPQQAQHHPQPQVAGRCGGAQADGEEGRRPGRELPAGRETAAWASTTRSLAKINPKLVYASISGFGQTGPYATRPGFDQIAQGMGGLMSITGLPGQGPVRVGIAVADLCAGLFAALGILTALLEREKSGKGQQIETSLLQAQIFMLDFQAARWLMAGEVPKQAGNNHPTSAPTGVYKTSDGYINIATTGTKMWQRMCEALGAPELIKRPEYVSAAERLKHRDALNADIDARTVRAHQQGMGRHPQRGRGADRPDLRHQ